MFHHYSRRDIISPFLFIGFNSYIDHFLTFITQWRYRVLLRKYYAVYQCCKGTRYQCRSPMMSLSFSFPLSFLYHSPVCRFFAQNCSVASNTTSYTLAPSGQNSHMSVVPFLSKKRCQVSNPTSSMCSIQLCSYMRLNSKSITRIAFMACFLVP